MGHLFAYGTLMCEEIMRRVAGAAPMGRPGTVRGYRCLAVRNEQYPGLVAAPQGEVEGVVYLDVTAEAWERLDLFEGDMYVRRHVEVRLNNGTCLEAEVYVVKPEYADRLEEREWSYAAFLAHGRGLFERSYRGYDEIDERR